MAMHSGQPAAKSACVHLLSRTHRVFHWATGSYSDGKVEFTPTPAQPTFRALRTNAQLHSNPSGAPPLDESSPVDASPDAKAWCEKALTAVFSLWDANRNQAWRGSQEYRDKQQPGAEEQFRPTVTFTAVLAFGECGLLSTDVRYGDGRAEVLASQLRVDGVAASLNPEEILRRIVTGDHWVDDALNSSEHGPQQAFDGNPMPLSPRASIMLGRLAPAIDLLTRHVPLVALKELQPALVTGLARIAQCFIEQLFPDPVRLFDEAPPGKPATLSSQIVLYATTALLHWIRLSAYLVEREGRPTTEDLIALGRQAWKNREGGVVPPFAEALAKAIPAETQNSITSLLSTFRAYCSRQVDRQMARKHVPLDPDYDCASLAFALNGLALLDEQLRTSEFFRTCVNAVVEGQNPDGCWPEGITVAYHESGLVGPVRQPSVEIALALADCVFRRTALFRCEPHEVALLNLALPALIRQLRYLAASYRELDGKYFGWADDRVRAPGEVRMAINATAARLVNTIRLAEIACGRATILERYKPEWPASEPWRGEKAKAPEEVWAEVVEPDQLTKPCERLLLKFIRPIADQMRMGHFFLRPQKHGVSFILYGPPGSGKTFVMSKFAAALGWPLISLNPGYFIEKGLELVEAVAGAIFADLMRLDHAVVFFDECDELFRDRSTSGAGARNILSFATASMLPKLQKLHDARKVIFVLGTNYVANIDLAIRRPGRFDEILLFDRPDKTARLSIASSEIAKRRGKSPDALDAADAAAAKAIAEESAGWMVEQIISRSLAYLQGKSFQAPVISDYADWCADDGPKELDGAGLELATIEEIKRRWDPIRSHAHRRQGGTASAPKQTAQKRGSRVKTQSPPNE